MKIAGFLKNSFVDYPGQIAAVLFVPLCNMDCYFCHNRHLLGSNSEFIPENEIFSFLENRRDFIDAVVISGGEPTIYPDLPEFLRRIKSLGYLTKLDTNGFNPEILKKLVSDGLLSYVATDIKAPLSKYRNLSEKLPDIELLKQTISFLLKSDMDYEFRTTFLPELLKEDILEIARLIYGAKNYYLQQFRPLKSAEGLIDVRAIKKPHLREYIYDTAEEVKNILLATNVAVRGVK